MFAATASDAHRLKTWSLREARIDYDKKKIQQKVRCNRGRWNNSQNNGHISMVSK
jgi:hypothetical protein